MSDRVWRILGPLTVFVLGAITAEVVIRLLKVPDWLVPPPAGKLNFATLATAPARLAMAGVVLVTNTVTAVTALALAGMEMLTWPVVPMPIVELSAYAMIALLFQR